MKSKLATLAVSGALLIPVYNPSDIGRESMLRALRHRGDIIDEKDAKIARLERDKKHLRFLFKRERRWRKREHRVLIATPSVSEAINLACATYGHCAELWRKARCESHLYPRAHNASGASGLFQFLPSTFRSTPYASLSIWSPYSNALAAGWMHSRGRGGEWVCR